MPTTCIVIGCGNRRFRDMVSFFNVPTIRCFKHNIKKNELSKKRREEWLKAIQRADLTESKIRHEKVCSIHFITGKPAALEDVTNPDWVPTQNMGHTSCIMKNSSKDLELAEPSKKRIKLVLTEPSTSRELDIKQEEVSEEPETQT